MALISCPECSKEVSSLAAACPSCAHPIAAQTKTHKRSGMHPLAKIFLIIAGLFALFITFGLYKSSTPEGQAKARARDAIDACWSEQNRKSLSPGSQRSVAGVCEMMENDFRQKYGVNP